MKTLLLHLAIAFILSYQFFTRTAAIPDNATTAGLLFLLVFSLLWLSAYFYKRSYFRKLPKAISLLFYFLKDLFIANLKVAHDIITPGLNMRPVVLALPLRVKTDVEITLLTCLITLTPGTLVLEISPDKSTMYLHVLYIKNGDQDLFMKQIQQGFERRILELTA